MTSYLKDKFADDKNVAIYLYEFIGEWVGGSISYEVRQAEDKSGKKRQKMTKSDKE